LRRNLAAATTACTIVCTVLGGALISGNTTHAAPSRTDAAAAGPRTPLEARGIASVPLPDQGAAPAERIPDRLAELRGARTVRVPPEPAASEATTARPESAAAEGSPAGRASGSTRASRAAGRRAATGGPRAATGGPRAARSAGARANGKARDARPPGDPRSTRRPPGSRPRTAVPADGSVVGFALAQVGKAYSFGHAGPDAFDCSGLVFAAYRMIGLYLPHSTYGLAQWGRPVQRSELRPGDLVFPSTGHVGIYIGNGRMVHASTERGGVKVSGIYAFQFARRVTG
jgi:cell wall-associated NlpC family hydrolase